VVRPAAASAINLQAALTHSPNSGIMVVQVDRPPHPSTLPHPRSLRSTDIVYYSREIALPDRIGRKDISTKPSLHPHISHCIGASGFRIGESSFARRTFADAEVFPDADRV